MKEYEKWIKRYRRKGDEPFTLEGSGSGFKLLDFWQWAYSDLATNSMRGILAEFIVASALKATRDVRNPWREYDLTTRSGIKVEVKSAAYLQSWPQTRESLITFSVAKAKRFAYLPSRLVGPLRRHADVYVFCLLKQRKKSSFDPLNLDHWEFYVLDKVTLNRKLGDQKRINLTHLLKLKTEKVPYSKLLKAVKNRSRK